MDFEHWALNEGSVGLSYSRPETYVCDSKNKEGYCRLPSRCIAMINVDKWDAQWPRTCLPLPTYQAPKPVTAACAP